MNSLPQVRMPIFFKIFSVKFRKIPAYLNPDPPKMGGGFDNIGLGCSQTFTSVYGGYSRGTSLGK